MARVLGNRGPAVRTRGVEAFLRNPLADQIALVAALLDDPHPLVRTGARKALALVARKAEFGAAVRDQAMRRLAGTKWRELEQATILLAVMDHKAAATRMVELLQFNRAEVFVAAAWGLRKLAVPETLPGQVAAIEARLQASRRPGADYPFEMINRELVQLSESVGVARYAPAGPVLARFIPKGTPTGPESRGAAIWALGLIHEKAPPASLVQQLIERLTDDDGMFPEDITVRHMCAISLGRMKAEEAVGSLRKYYSGELSTYSFTSACGWALQQITGEKMATSGLVKALQVGWFLEPID
jgi:HEAT repeat protein